jgi:hypothetical protein
MVDDMVRVVAQQSSDSVIEAGDVTVLVGFVGVGGIKGRAANHLRINDLNLVPFFAD